MTLTPRTIRDSFVLLVWGGFVLWLTFSNRLSTYLHPSLQPYTVVAGVLLIILALFPLRSLLRAKSHKHSGACDHDHDESHHRHHAHHHAHDHGSPCCHHEEEILNHHHCCGHAEEPSASASCCEGHHSHAPRGAAMGFLFFKTVVLLLPLIVVLSGKSNLYTLSTIANRGVVQDLASLPAAKASSQPSDSKQKEQNTEVSETATASGVAMPIQVIDLLYAVQMPSYREEFEGKEVEMVGQFVPLTVGNPKGNRFQIIRLFITCCAADAKPVGVTVQYEKPLKAAEMGWFKITGKPTFPMEGGRRTAVLVADKVEECPAPSEPFVY